MNRTLFCLLPVCLAGSAHAAVLDFGNGPTPPSQCTLALDGSGPLTACTVTTYISQYNNLYGVLWADGGDGNSFARIEIKALVPGDSVSLTGLDLGAWSNNTLGTTLNVYAIGGGAPLFSYTGLVGNSNIAATHFAPNISAAGGLWIDWQLSAYNVGIDNIEYSVSAVPEPAAAGTLLVGLAGLAAWLHRRRQP